MLFSPNAARIAMLLLSVSALAVSVPADAKKKEDPKAEAGPAQLKLSNEVRAPAIQAQTALTAKDVVAGETAVAAVEAAAKTPDEVYFAQTLRLQLEVQKLTASANGDSAAFAKGEVALAKPLDALIANPLTKPEDAARYNNIRGEIEYNQRKYKEALAFYTRARELGFKSDNLGLIIAQAKLESGDVLGGVAELKALIAAENAAGRKAPEDWYRRAISKLSQAKEQAQFVAWLQEWVKAYPSPQNWRQAIYNYGFVGAEAQKIDKRQRIDLFRLMRAANALADTGDYTEYAQSVVDIGLNAEAIRVIDAGRAAGKIQASSANMNSFYTSAKAGLAADKSFAEQERLAAASPTGDLSAQTGDAYLGAAKYPEAIAAYMKALAKPFAPGSTRRAATTADDVNTHLGIAQALSGDKAGAKASFAKVTTEPRAGIASFWMAWLDAPTAAGTAPAAQ